MLFRSPFISLKKTQVKNTRCFLIGDTWHSTGSAEILNRLVAAYVWNVDENLDGVPDKNSSYGFSYSKAARHNKSANLLYVDGSAKAVDIKTWGTNDTLWKITN